MKGRHDWMPEGAKANPGFAARAAADPYSKPVHQPSLDTKDLAEPGMFASGDEKVINWKGETYYKSCNAIVYTFPPQHPSGHAASYCVKREHHAGIHEDFHGRTKTNEIFDFDWSYESVETAVFEALGAASTCWDSLDGAGVFHSERAKAIGDALYKRIREAGPIYG